MCGIAGYAGRGTRAQLEKAAMAIVRRGPDDGGFYQASGVGFAFRRLSIIDVEGGHQPMSNESQTIWVMLNGEIYNHLLLRDELSALGYAFVTRSDTEVIVHGYAAWGEGVFERIEGMFAIAIWDVKQSALFLARDRMGKKPLYYTTEGSTVWFASETKALLAAGVLSKDIHAQAVDLYFRTDAVPTPESIWQGVKKLLPGSYVRVVDGRLSSPTRFWHLSRPSRAISSSHEAVELLRTTIDQAVKDRLMADVPLGLFLSGGLDSAVIAASAMRQAKHRLKAFTIGFADRSHDETKAAAAVAHALCLDHHVAVLSDGEALGMLDEAVRCLDEPLADPAIIPQLLLARFAKQSLTVALAGDGGDELLYGYQHVPLHAFAMDHEAMWRRGGWLSPFLASVPAGSGYFSLGFKLQRLARGLGRTDLWSRDLAWRGAVTDTETNALFTPAFRDQVKRGRAEEILRGYSDEIADWATPWQQWSWGYLRSFLMDEVMVKVDRATMWFGMEGRSPLLDRRVVEASFAIPDEYKLGEWANKRLFKELLHGIIPGPILDRPKHGFGVPTATWLRGPLKKRLQELSEPGFLREQGLFEPKTVARWIKEHEAGRPDRRKELWGFLMFQLWYGGWRM